MKHDYNWLIYDETIKRIPYQQISTTKIYSYKLLIIGVQLINRKIAFD